MVMHCVAENPNRTAQFAIDQGPILSIVHTTSYVICCWIVIINGLLITCFYINRWKRWPVFTTIINSLVIIDFIVGVTYVGINIVWDQCEISLWLCSTLWGMYVCSQGSALFHMVAICLSRNYMLRKMRVTYNQELPIRVIYMASGIIWVAVTIIFMIPFITWAKDVVTVEKCILSYMFSEENLMKVQIYLFVSYLFPIVTIVVLYFALLLKVRQLGKNIAPLFTNGVDKLGKQLSERRNLTTIPAQPNSDQTPEQLKDSNGTIQSQQKIQTTCITSRSQETSPQPSCSYHTQNRNEKTVKNSRHDRNQMLRYPTKTGKIHIAIGKLGMTCTDKHSPVSEHRETKPNTSHGNVKANQSLKVCGRTPLQRAMPTIPRQQPVESATQTWNSQRNRPLQQLIMKRNRMVVLTIGGITLLIIVCTVPLGIIYGTEAVKPETDFSYTTWLVCYTCLLLNSAINPIFYIIQLPVLKKAFPEMMVSAWDKVRGMLKL